mgnify:CR=1 FL=1
MLFYRLESNPSDHRMYDKYFSDHCVVRPQDHECPIEYFDSRRVGSSICGGSAIAATAPVIDADDTEVAQAISVIFFFNVIAAVLFPRTSEVHLALTLQVEAPSDYLPEPLLMILLRSPLLPLPGTVCGSSEVKH